MAAAGSVAEFAASAASGVVADIGTAWGSGDEAGGSAPVSTQRSPQCSASPPMSPSSSFRREFKIGAESFTEEQQRLHMLLSENHETVFLDDWEGSRSRSCSSSMPSVRVEDASLVKNLDTGDTSSLLEDTPVSSGQPEDSKRLARSTSKPWDGLQQELRQNNEALWKAAETGRIERLCDLLAPVWTIMEDPSMEASNIQRTDTQDFWRSSVASASSAGPMSADVGRSSIIADGSVVGERGSAYSGSPKGSMCLAVGKDLGVHPAMMKVDVDSRSLHGRTALHIAASNGQAECMEVLLRARAEIDARTDAGFTALHLACERGCLAAVWGLLAARCDTAVQTKQGELGLHLAASKGHTEVLSVLLQSCTHDLLGVRNSYGQRPSEVCLDVETNTLLANNDGTHYAGSESSSSVHTGDRKDSYAGRTQFGSALRRNSRADTVHRLLHRTGADKKMEETTEVLSGDAAAGSSSRRRKSHRAEPERRPCFSKLRDESSEAVGPDSFSLKAVLGKGSFGEVYQVVHRSSGETHAMKVLRKSKIFGRNLKRYAMTERNLLSYIRHPFIVRLHYAFQTPTCLVLVLHFCPGGNLSQLIGQESRLQEPTAQLYIAEIFLAIEYLHERHVVFRDLKPENVVLDEKSHAMLTDFGLSKEGVEGMQGTRSFCGSVAYLAPEILARRGHGPPVDLYGLGVLLYEMLAGRPPYYSRDRETLFRNIISGSLAVPSTASSRATSLIHSLMRRDPAQRLGALNTSEVRAHPFFFTLDFDRVLKREVRVPPPRRQRKEKDQPPRSDNARVASPFEGALEAKVRRLSSSNSQDVSGWEFGADALNLGESAHRTPPGSRIFSGTSDRGRPAEAGSRRRGRPGCNVLAPTFF